METEDHLGEQPPPVDPPSSDDGIEPGSMDWVLLEEMIERHGPGAVSLAVDWIAEQQAGYVRGA